MKPTWLAAIIVVLAVGVALKIVDAVAHSEWMRNLLAVLGGS